MAILPNRDDIYYARNRTVWRKWLKTNHRTLQQIWLVQHRKSNPNPCVSYDEAVQEALCFGWIDSKPRKRDEQSYLLFFSRRKPKSPWSASNKKRVEELIQKKLMTPAGIDAIEVARKNGSWSLIDDAEASIMPADLVKALTANRTAAGFFEQFPPSAKRGIYTWISLAKTEETRRKRIEETVRLAERNIRANQWRPGK